MATFRFDGTAPLPAGITCTRASTGYARDNAGMLQAFAPNVLRRTDRGLTYEPVGATNDLKYSDDLSNAAWLKGSTLTDIFTVSASSIPPPKAGVVPLKFVAANGTAGLFLRQNLAFSAQQRAGSIYIYVPPQGGTTNWSITNDYNDVDNSSVFTSSVFGQWVRARDLVANLSVARSRIDFNLLRNSGNPPIGFEFHACLPQNEAGGSTTTYIPTGAVAAARAAEQVTLPPLPAGTGSVRITYDDASVETRAATPGPYTLPTDLARTVIREIKPIWDGVPYVSTRLVYPPPLLRFTSLAWQIRETSRSGGPSVLGSEQIVSGPAGRWYASLTLSISAMSWNGSEQLLLYRALMARFRGRSGVIDLPYFDGRGPGQLLALAQSVSHSDGTPFGDGSLYAQGTLPVTADLNATTLVLTYPAGVQPLPGQCITMPDGWMHQITDLLSQDGATWTVSIEPWLRADYPAGVPVEVDRPTSRMRLLTDESGILTVQAGQAWSNPTLEFVEAF